MSEKEIIRDSIIQIVKRSGYTSVSQMTQRDFEFISEAIREKSGITISGITLKRLSFGEFSRLPQIATLNAIANYFDCKTWQAYKASREQPEESQKARDEVLPPFKKNLRRIHLGPMPIYISALVVVTLLGLNLFRNPRAHTIADADQAAFSCQRSTQNDLPNTVVFNYNVDDVQADSFFIQQSWDKNRRVRVFKNKYTLTDIYYEPGYHIAKLIANDSVIKTIEISIPTDRWFFYAIDNVANYTTEYIKASDFIRNGILSITKDQLKENNVDYNKDNLYHYTFFPTESKVKSNEFRMITRIRMTEVRNSLCPHITLELFCQGNFILMKTTKPGCANKATVLFGEEFRGSEVNLVPLTFDVTQWTDVEISVINNVGHIKINSQEVFSAPCFDTPKFISGFAIISNGLSEIDNVELTSTDGIVMYKNDFSNDDL